MNPENSIDEREAFVLFEGPSWGDAKFYGEWLLAAAEANALWEEAIENTSFQAQVESLLCLAIPNFGIGAAVFLSLLEKGLASALVPLESEDGHEFVMMVEMGFFVLTGQRYQMLVPTQLNMQSVKSAALKFAETEDGEYYLHPEYLVATLRYPEAEAWQRRLRVMNEVERLADRILLIETAVRK